MNDPWVVVVGTLGGVILTSVGGLLGIILTTRHQRAVAERQTRQDLENRLRTERRETFVNYLSAYQDMYGKALTIADSRFQRGSKDQSVEAPLAQNFLEQAPEESARFSRAYHELVITGGLSTRKAARDCTSKLWDLAYASAEADADSFARLKDQARPSRQSLREAMRAELGVE
jgi:hypothetical protein